MCLSEHRNLFASRCLTFGVSGVYDVFASLCVSVCGCVHLCVCVCVCVCVFVCLCDLVVPVRVV